MNTKAVVKVTVEIGVGSWGAACQLEQLYTQAAEEACQKIGQAVATVGGRIIGKPLVTAIMVAEE